MGRLFMNDWNWDRMCGLLFLVKGIHIQQSCGFDEDYSARMVFRTEEEYRVWFGIGFFSSGLYRLYSRMRKSGVQFVPFA